MSTGSRPVFEHRHRVTFEETNAVGNVYFATYFRWQGTVRELFLAQRAPGVLAELGTTTTLVTVDASCNYLGELWPFDEILIRLDAREPVANRLTLVFEFLRPREDRAAPDLVARGQQTVAWLRRDPAGGLVPVPVPEELVTAMDTFRRTGSEPAVPVAGGVRG